MPYYPFDAFLFFSSCLLLRAQFFAVVLASNILHENHKRVIVWKKKHSLFDVTYAFTTAKILPFDWKEHLHALLVSLFCFLFLASVVGRDEINR